MDGIRLKTKQRLINDVITDFWIKYTVPGRYIWPGNFLKRLQRLSRLSLVVAADVYHLPIDNIEFFPIETLNYFKFDCYNQGLFVDRSAKRIFPKNNLTQNFPNLEHLDLEGISNECPLKFLRYLPPKLKSLSIPVRVPYSSSGDSLGVNIYLKFLSKHLTDLNITLFDNISGWADLDFSILPPSLTSFETNAVINQDAFDRIPQGFKVLRVAQCRVNIKRISPFLPFGLQTLSISQNSSESCIDDSFSHLQYLESLEIMGYDDNSATITKWPPNLKEFRAITFELKDIETYKLPQNLTRLHLEEVRGVTPEFIASLPNTLIDLSIHPRKRIEASKLFEILPKNLESLSVSLTIIENTSALPQSLKHLRLVSHGSAGFDIANLDRLPPKLETLILNGVDSPQSVFTVELPPTLQEMKLECNVIIDDTVIGRLPRGMKSLSLKTRDNITDAGASLFPPNLTFLYLQRNTKMTNHAISKLPRNLTYLNVHENPNFTDECVKDLPRTLVHLSFDGTTGITYRSCKDLPPYLRQLSLVRCMDWKEEVMKDMPKYMQPFYAAEQLWFTRPIE